jgi:phosphatidylserine synthase 2
MFTSLKRYTQILFYIWFVLSVDSMNFFMKYVLWVPAESDILKARVAIWAFTAIITSKEFFEYVDDPNCKRVGPFFWLSTYTIGIEYMVWFKFSRGYIVMIPFPTGVKIIHAIYIVLILAGAVYSYQNGQKEDTSNNKKAYNLIDPEFTIEDTQKILKESSKKSN